MLVHTSFAWTCMGKHVNGQVHADTVCTAHGWRVWLHMTKCTWFCTQNRTLTLALEKEKQRVAQLKSAAHTGDGGGAGAPQAVHPEVRHVLLADCAVTSHHNRQCLVTRASIVILRMKH